MFALSKGNKRKWVNGIEMHCRMCYNLASLDEHAQKLCQCVDMLGECVPVHVVCLFHQDNKV